MKTLWTITLTSKGAIEINQDETDDLVTIRADYSYVDQGSLIFANAHPQHTQVLCIFADRYWVMAEREKGKE